MGFKLEMAKCFELRLCCRRTDDKNIRMENISLLYEKHILTMFPELSYSKNESRKISYAVIEIPQVPTVHRYSLVRSCNVFEDDNINETHCDDSAIRYSHEMQNKNLHSAYTNGSKNNSTLEVPESFAGEELKIFKVDKHSVEGLPIENENKTNDDLTSNLRFLPPMQNRPNSLNDDGNIDNRLYRKDYAENDNGSHKLTHEPENIQANFEKLQTELLKTDQEDVSHIPGRGHEIRNLRNLIKGITQQILIRLDADGECVVEEILEHLEKVSRLLKVERDRSLGVVRSEYRDLRARIEAKFHKTIRKSQDRWKATNEKFIKVSG
ncbi:hypothetical protein BEWA_005100 [Theileria equi strain WA]|uniref:Uncharacterized protein n=1 Tax=Theileria equi strain WA TaxID=1537102 RepID=L0AZS3_THEEQ|nr:hypothetical protein BEWA_005100 [Theileria equi strain WA]AFZ81102.1 hypothetical protein BEWA_005100 [Theileria equi strain WA]|eukprot:XP_004830768.1 hypothetical protein BEWA_005100 [Theileria equi strain WA]